jgi:hypothetical protein
MTNGARVDWADHEWNTEPVSAVRTASFVVGVRSESVMQLL